jgi:hypothetical protein
MHRNALHLVHCIIMLLSHIWLIYSLGHGCAEPELKEPMEQAEVETSTNLALDQGKPWCIQPILLVFYFWILLYVIVGCALSW